MCYTMLIEETTYTSSQSEQLIKTRPLTIYKFYHYVVTNDPSLADIG